MTRRAGTADLPLHHGRVPAWLGRQMARLGAVITEAIVQAYGRDEFLRRLSSPFWFQSFGALMGMDWHSSGITTSVIGALKHGLAPLSGELGLHVCGGRGAHSRRTPAELVAIGERVGVRRRGLGAGKPARGQGRQRGRAGRLRPLPARLHRGRRRRLGGGAAGHERRQPHRTALPLAVRRPAGFRRCAAHRDRGPQPGQDHQSHRPTRQSIAAGPARPARGAWAGRGRAGGRGARENGRA